MTIPASPRSQANLQICREIVIHRWGLGQRADFEAMKQPFCLAWAASARLRDRADMERGTGSDATVNSG